jgi:hypothetical protein
MEVPMSLVKVIAVALAMASGTSGSMGQLTQSSPWMSAGEGRAGEKADPLFTWWSADMNIDRLFTWAQPGERSEMRVAFWQPAEERPMLVAFSTPELRRDFVLIWSRPDESRPLLFTWSNPLATAAEEGAAGGEPRTR